MRLPFIAAGLVGLLSSVALAAPIRLAVLEFQSASTAKELEPLGKGLQSMLATDLAQVPSLTLVERERLKDIESELKLGASGALDRKTAARVGKLLGATHLVGGTFTVVGEKMRIDARFFSVEGGEVLLAEQIEGERSAFFELEKSLAQKIVAGAGVKLAPKERATLGKVQTADFDAFRKFSQGIAAFDDKRYPEAIAALEEASRIDKDFTLAKQTLSEYGQLIDKINAKAEAIQSASQASAAERTRLAFERLSSKWQATIDRLWELAARTGDGAAQQGRIGAIYALAVGYDHGFELTWNGGDRFALRRMSEEMQRRYHIEALPLFPSIPPILNSQFFRAPKAGQSVDDWVRGLYSAMEDWMKKRPRDVAEFLERAALDNTGEPLMALHLDARQQVRLRQQLARQAATLSGKPQVPSETLARALRDVLELDDSTALFAKMTLDEKQPHRLRELAKEVETNRFVAATLAAARTPLAREYMLLLSPENGRDVLKKCFTAVSKVGPEGLYYLADARRFPGEGQGYILLDEHPAWLVRTGHDGDLVTGPRTDRLRAGEVRYYPSVSERRDNRNYDNVPEALIVVDGTPRRDPGLSFHVDHAPAPAGDWWPPDGGMRPDAIGKARENQSRPEVGASFGITDASGDHARGYSVLIDGRGVRLVSFQRTEFKDDTKVNGKRTELAIEVLEEKKAQLGGEKRLDVAISFKGDQLKVQVNRSAFSFKAPAERGGFYGIHFRGMGYAAVSGLKVSH